jgi:very-short-patch-repair endonuclease
MRNLEYDSLRTEIINKFNIKIIRFENYLILEDIDKVLGIIKSNFEDIPPLAPPDSGGEK